MLARDVSRVPGAPRLDASDGGSDDDAAAAPLTNRRYGAFEPKEHAADVYRYELVERIQRVIHDRSHRSFHTGVAQEYVKAAKAFAHRGDHATVVFVARDIGHDIRGIGTQSLGRIG